MILNLPIHIQDIWLHLIKLSFISLSKILYLFLGILIFFIDIGNWVLVYIYFLTEYCLSIRKLLGWSSSSLYTGDGFIPDKSKRIYTHPLHLTFFLSFSLLYVSTFFSFIEVKQTNKNCIYLRCTNQFYLFIYLFMVELGLHCCARAFCSCGTRGLLFVVVRGLLTAVASPVAEHRLQAHRLQ